MGSRDLSMAPETGDVAVAGVFAHIPTGNHRNVRDFLGWKSLLPSGKHTKNWKITIFHGKIHYKWSFSIAMLNYQRLNPERSPEKKAIIEKILRYLIAARMDVE